MSEYKFSCPNCDQHLTATPAWAGRSLKCPTCQHEFAVPQPPAGTAAPSAPPSIPVVRATGAAPAVPAATARPAGPPRVPPRPVTALRPAAAAPTAMPPSAAPPLPSTAAAAGAKNGAAKLAMIMGISAIGIIFIAIPVTAVIPVLGAFVGLPLMFLSFVAGILAVVFGHKGRGRIKRGEAATGGGQALTGVILGYLVIVGIISLITVGVIVALKFKDQIQSQMGQNGRPSRSVPFTPPPNFQPQRTPPGAPDRMNPNRTGRNNRTGRTTTQPQPAMPSNDPQVSTDPASATIPQTPAAGTIGGDSFRCDKANFSSFMNLLTLQEGNGMAGDKDLKVFFFPSGDDKVVLGRTWTFGAGEGTGRPHVHYTGGNQGGAEMRNYALRIEFEQPKNNKVKGKIYVELPASTQTKVAGTFEAVVER